MRPTTPPTTPPAIAPVWSEEELSRFPGLGVADGVEDGSDDDGIESESRPVLVSDINELERSEEDLERSEELERVEEDEDEDVVDDDVLDDDVVVGVKLELVLVSRPAAGVVLEDVLVSESESDAVVSHEEHTSPGGRAQSVRVRVRRSRRTRARRFRRARRSHGRDRTRPHRDGIAILVRAGRN